MLVTRKLKYFESYVPPRCRKPRLREVAGDFSTEVTELGAAEAPIALREQSPYRPDFRDHGDPKRKVREYRWYQEKLWVPVRRSNFLCLGRRQLNRPARLSDVHFHESQPHVGREQVQEALDRCFSSLLLVDGVLHEQIAEPRYVVMTFGLGCNHGGGWGTAMSVNHHYNSNIHRDRYYRVDQEADANAEGLRIALARGDTKAVPHFKKRLYPRFEVLMPEVLRLDPKTEHGEGCAFINRVDQLTQIKDPVVAGLLVMAEAFKA